MDFIRRDLKAYAEPMRPADLAVGSVYFAVTFLDDEMLIPEMQPMVFIGRDLEPTDTGVLYFQDCASYRRGVRYFSASHEEGESSEASFYTGPESESNHIFTYENALDVLLRCALRRPSCAT